MYYEEKIINGVVHWRTDPNDDFQPYSLAELSSRYMSAVAELNRWMAAPSVAGTFAVRDDVTVVP